MDIDLSILKNIDFTNPGNLIFFAIFSVIALIIFFIFLLVTAKIIKGIKRLFIGVFNLDVKKPKFDQKESAIEPVNMPKPRIVGGDSIKSFDSKEKIGPEKDSKQKYEEKEQEKIEEGLSKLKSGGSGGEETLESRMPLRQENQQEVSALDEIKIPRPKRFGQDVQPEQVFSAQEKSGIVPGYKKEEVVVGSDLHGQALQRSKESAPDIKKEADKGKVPTVQDGTIFRGAPEVSRVKLEYQMRVDPKIWQTARQQGLNLSPVERAKLVKEVFSSALGRNISKADLKLSVRKLNQKMLSTKDPAAHAKIRKEIKFFKKIGGI